LSILAVLYALSPYDLLPDFIPGWGWIDDLLLLGACGIFIIPERPGANPLVPIGRHAIPAPGTGMKKRQIRKTTVILKMPGPSWALQGGHPQKK